MLLNQKEALDILIKYNIAFPQTAIFLDRGDISNLKINYPVALKIDSPEIMHKSDMGGVFTDISSSVELWKKVEILEQRLKEKQIKEYKFVLQEMVKGTEFIIGMKSDKTFGKVIVFGLGGVFVEVLKDVSMRIAPLSIKDCKEMMDEIKGKKLLEGFRNNPAVNKEKIIELLLKVSQLSLKEKEISEIDFNPVIANEKTALVVDARIIREKNA